MEAVKLASLRSLSQHSGVSRRQIEWLRQGKIQHLSIENVLRLSATLNLSLMDLLIRFEDPSSEPLSPLLNTKPVQDSQESALRADYQRLQGEIETLEAHLLETFQAETLNRLESLILQWPTAAHAAQQNPTLPAIRLIPLLKPLEQLLQAWEIEAIATVSDIIPYDPTLHQWVGETAPPQIHHPVQVSHIGYRQKGRLLYRAKVRLPKPDTAGSS
jgi:DNA-binding Xre family transcriptional regulator/molecular chaperone GrpE (heat shock protein)